MHTVVPWGRCSWRSTKRTAPPHGTGGAVRIGPIEPGKTCPTPCLANIAPSTWPCGSFLLGPRYWPRRASRGRSRRGTHIECNCLFGRRIRRYHPHSPWRRKFPAGKGRGLRPPVALGGIGPRRPKGSGTVPAKRDGDSAWQGGRWLGLQKLEATGRRLPDTFFRPIWTELTGAPIKNRT